jgi:hypothetical protein
MHHPLLSALLGTALAFVTAAAHADSPRPDTSRNVPVTALQFGATGVTDATGKALLAAPAYGDLSKGPHGTFIRMPAGFASHVHRHHADYWGVVISGVAINAAPQAADRATPLPAGSYWFQKGDEAHVTRCISATECVFFIGQQGAFDYTAETADTPSH